MIVFLPAYSSAALGYAEGKQFFKESAYPSYLNIRPNNDVRMRTYVECIEVLFLKRYPLRGEYARHAFAVALEYALVLMIGRYVAERT